MNNDLVLSNNSSFRKNPKEMSVEELDIYLASKQYNRNMPYKNYKEFSFTKNIKNSSNQSLSSSPRKSSPPYNPLTSSQINSKAASEYIKTLQDKIQKIQKENSDLKKELVKLNKLLSKERNERNDPNFTSSDNKSQIDQLLIENQKLFHENESLKQNFSFLQEKINLLENEKKKHIEKALQEKDMLSNTIYDLRAQISTLNTKYMMLDGEYQTLFSKYNEKKRKKAKSKSKEKSVPTFIKNTAIREKALATSSSKSLGCGGQKTPVKQRPVTRNTSFYTSQSTKTTTRNISAKTCNCIQGKKKQTRNEKKKENLNHIDSIDRLVNESANNYFISNKKNFNNNIELANISSQIQILESNIEQLKFNYQNLVTKFNVRLDFIIIL